MLEIALGQEQVLAAETILECAERGEIELAIPWISLAEPFSTVKKRSQDRIRFRKQLEARLNDMRRSQALETDVQSLEFAPPLLILIDRDESDRLTRAVERILDVATVLTIDAAVFRTSLADRTRFGFDPEDAFVYASVVANLTTNESPGPHYFVTRDSDDIGDPGIANELRGLGCELLLSLRDMALLLEQPLSD